MSADPRISTEAAVAGLAEQVKAIGREIGQMRRENAEKLQSIADDVGETKEQTKITNGRVNKHDIQIHDIEIREANREAARQQEDDRRDRTFRRMSWAITTALAVLSIAVGVLIAIVG